MAEHQQSVDGSNRSRKGWLHYPNTPVAYSPLFDWPPRPIAVLKWFAGYWFAASSVVAVFVIAVFTWQYWLPAYGAMAQIELRWIATLWGINAFFLILVAGSLHLYFYTFNGQGDSLKYDPRDLAKQNAAFTFDNQVWDNMFWSIASGVTFLTAWQAGYYLMAANGLAPQITLIDNITWSVCLFVAIPVWSSFHFYWIHRLLHWPPLYRLAHALHHRNINVGPWSGISMHPIEHAIYFSTLAIHLVVPSHPLHVLFHLYFQSIGPAFSHSGYEAMMVAKTRVANTGVFFHQLHHRYFECNYGTVEMPWDRWFGSYHDGTDAGDTVVKRRRIGRMS